MYETNLNLIPIPKKVQNMGDLTPFTPNIFIKDEELIGLTDVTKQAFYKIYGQELVEKDGGISCAIDKNMSKGAYCLNVGETIQIKAADYEGCAYALATVLQLLEEKDGQLYFPEIDLYDMPDKDYRGLMIDLARCYHPIRAIFSYVDLCFFYKIKYLHLHFVDDEGYTLPSKAFPKLVKEGCSYTEADIKKLCQYAKERNVILVPEIEIPGHSKLLTRAYPEIFADKIDEELKQKLKAGAPVPGAHEAVSARYESIVCAGSQVCYDALITMIDELLELFPDSPYVHLGGDEACIQLWEHCSECQSYMKQHSIKNVNELFSHLMARVTDYILDKGRTPILWEGFSKEYAHLISKDVIVVGWETHYQMPGELLENGFKVINCSWKPLYLVPISFGNERWGPKDVMRWSVYRWEHWLPLSESTLNPINVEPTENVIGGQLCSWECTYGYEVPFVVENLAALSERTWSVRRYCTDEEFMRKLAIQSKRAYLLMQEQ